MGVGSAFSAGYGAGATRKQQRSLMPMVNTLSDIIDRRKKRGNVRIAGSSGPSAEERADQFFAESEAREAAQHAKGLAEAERMANEEKEAREQELIAAEEDRRQEIHEGKVAAEEQARNQKEASFKRATAKEDRLQAYEDLKKGLMMQSSRLANDAMVRMMPDLGDVMNEGVTEEGARSYTGRPRNREVPQFIFDPDSDYVGVIFPGQKKPTVFKNVEQVFQNVVAPMNPAHEKTKDQIQAEKVTKEARFKNKKLTAEIHKEAHNAAMERFEADGYYQPALFNQEEYDRVYTDYINKATGGSATQQNKGGSSGARKSPPSNIYRGEDPPQGFPDARRGKDGGWYVKRGKGWAPILEDSESNKPVKPDIKSPPKKPITKAGVDFPKRKTVVRKKIPPRPAQGAMVPWTERAQPPGHPDAQYDEAEGVWKSFNEKTGNWEPVMVPAGTLAEPS